ncbi:MAG: S1 family peptidase [Myxococcota bacterium]|nr:S1 family peptidase [Myxococcota bacterium]
MGQIVLLLLGVLVALGCQGVDESTTAENQTQAPKLGTRSDAIRNGTREPSILGLNDGQKLAVGWLHPTGAPGQNFCTATLVAPRVLATARHCLEGQQRFDVSFGVGLLPSAPRASFRVETGHLHPYVDAAVLILEEDAVAALPEIRPIPFNRTALEQSMVGTEVEAAGYGETYDRTRSGRYFAVVQLAAVTSSEVIVDGRGRQGLCFGDSGGPVMAILNDAPVVLGVESWGDPSCVGVDHLVRLDAIAPWIDSMTESVDREPDPECMTVPAVGECIDDVLHRCQNGRYTTQSCDPDTERCRVADPATGEFGCIPYDPCAEVGSAGICDENRVVRCRFGQIVYEECSVYGQVCGSDDGGAFCTTKEGDADDADTESSTVPDESEMLEFAEESPTDDSEPDRSSTDSEDNPPEDRPMGDALDDFDSPEEDAMLMGGFQGSVENTQPGPDVNDLFDPSADDESGGAAGGCSSVAHAADAPSTVFGLLLAVFGARRRIRRRQ